MSYHSVSLLSQVQEPPSRYSSFKEKFTYEISLRTAFSNDWLKELRYAHRLVETLSKGDLLGQYDLWDFLIWPDGFFTRISLKGSFSLSEFLIFLKEKSTPAGNSVADFWDDELQWIKLIPPEKLLESTEAFLQTASRIHQGLQQSNGYSPSLFFFYRNSRLSK
jgi:hypothetical protein